MPQAAHLFHIQLQAEHKPLSGNPLSQNPLQSFQLLFYTLCDGLRLEVWHRKLTELVARDDFFSITNEREIGLASLLALHLRSVGFRVQLDAYFNGKPERRPDFGIWLPASKEYIYLELKQTAWGDYSNQYYYAKAIEDIEKLDGEKDPLNQRNGLITVGFSDPKKRSELLLENSKKFLSEKIARDFPIYEQIGLEQIDFQEMDKKASDSVLGLWFRTEWDGS